MISYQSGKKNDKANALTRKPNKQSTDNKDKRRKHSVRVLMPLNQIDHDVELQPIDKDPGKVRANSDTVSDASEETSTLPERVTEFNQNNKLYNKICLYFTNSKGLKKSEIYLKKLKVKGGLLMKRHWLWVADKDQLQLEVIKEAHDQSAMGHPSIEKTLEMARRHYYWPGMKKMI